MEYLKKMETRLEDAARESTEAFGKFFGKEEYMKTIPAYVYFMKSFFEFRYELRALEMKKKMGEKMDFSAVNGAANEVNKAAKALNSTHAKLGLKIGIPALKVKSGGADAVPMPFYKIHKAKFRKWSAKTPREKIIKSLEVWTGLRGEEAVLEAVQRLQDDADKMFDFVLTLHQRQDLTNIAVNVDYMKICCTMFNYYIKHRKKYLGTVPDKRKIKSVGNTISINLQDEFINVNIKLKTCDFGKFNVIMRNFIEALDKVDAKAMGHLVFLTGAGPVEAPDFRKNLKREIMDLVAEIADDMTCTEAPKAVLEIQKGADVATILQTVEKFILMEKKIETDLKDVIEYGETHLNNVKRLGALIGSLTGPDVRPCLIRMAPHVRKILDETEGAIKGKKITATGERIIRDLISH
jgi:hypothetical protein